MRLRTTEGDILLERCEGTVCARSHEGTIAVRDGEGSVELETGQGDIRATLRHLRTRGVFITKKGAVSVQIYTGRAPIDAEALEGDIDLALPSEFAGHLEAAAGGGVIACHLPLDIYQSSPGSLLGRLGDEDGPVVRAQTFQGDVRVRALTDEEAPGQGGDEVR